MISTTQKFIFIHVPKTAGTSIADAFGRRYSSFVRGKEWDEFGAEKHASLLDLTQILSSDMLSSYFKFAFVRNPYCRMVSYYQHLLKTNQMPEGLDLNVSFLQFMEWLQSAQLNRMERRTQLSYLVGTNGKVGIDFIGRFETLDQCMRRVCDALNMKKRPLKHLNCIDYPPYPSFYCERSKEIVELVFNEDLKEFGYGF